eukprot:TRINITY_DN3832_c0_g4_i1.p1 TRINITY_DN3832_c0_g4~~TRINITY_DN3832_c0_g4_i1.p1  ORF type:complete len:461 (+),score=56.83 TRINITY_DN3832_c0_g4_i1:163-1545(+)
MPGDTHGSLNVQVHADVVSTDESSTAAVFSQQVLNQLLAIETANMQTKALVSFLEESIPKFADLNNYTKERLIKHFKEVSFLPNTVIMKEGSVPSAVYLIKEGTCSILSMQYLNGMAQEGNSQKVHYTLYRDISKKLSLVKAVRGYMSLSTSMHQLRTVGHREWIGEEVLLEIPGRKSEYSAIAKTSVTALEVSRGNLRKFPRTIVEWFKENARSKLEWQEQRKEELRRVNRRVERMESPNEFLDEALDQVKMKFPQASSRLTTSIHKDNFLNQDMDLEKQDEAIQKTARPRGKILPIFNCLREIMRTKQVGIKLQGKTARQKSCDFASRSHKKSIVPHTDRQTQQLKLIKHERANTSPLRKTLKSQLGGRTERVKSGGLLETASTFRTSYNRAALPTIRRPQTTLRLPIAHREAQGNQTLERIKALIESANRSFKVGLRNITVANSQPLKGSVSPHLVN